MALEFIPMIGPLTAAAIILLVTVVSGVYFGRARLLVAYRMFQDYFLLAAPDGPGRTTASVAGSAGVSAVRKWPVSREVFSRTGLAMARILYVRTRVRA